MWYNIHVPTLSASIVLFLLLFVAYKVYQYQKEKSGEVGAVYKGAWDPVLPGW